jgi:hypothetical protein
MRVNCISLPCCSPGHCPSEKQKDRKIADTWQPNRILAALEKLHPQFYPQPSRQLPEADGRVERVEPILQGFLTKKDLIRLHGECGEVLHRGSINSVFSAALSSHSFQTVGTACQKIITLLNHHQIQMNDPKVQYWVLMQAVSDGKVHWARMEEIPDPNKLEVQR